MKSKTIDNGLKGTTIIHVPAAEAFKKLASFLYACKLDLDVVNFRTFGGTMIKFRNSS